MSDENENPLAVDDPQGVIAEAMRACGGLSLGDLDHEPELVPVLEAVAKAALKTKYHRKQVVDMVCGVLGHSSGEPPIAARWKATLAERVAKTEKAHRDLLLAWGVEEDPRVSTARARMREARACFDALFGPKETGKPS